MFELGPDAPIYRAWQDLNADCARRNSASPYERCSLHAPALSGLLAAER